MLLVNIVSQSAEQTKRVLTGPRLIMSPVCIDSSKSTEIKSWNNKKLNYLIFSKSYIATYMSLQNEVT